MNTVEPVMTVDELAAFLKVSPVTVRAWAKTKKIPSHRLGWRTLRFVLTDVLAALDKPAK